MRASRKVACSKEWCPITSLVGVTASHYPGIAFAHAYDYDASLWGIASLGMSNRGNRGTNRGTGYVIPEMARADGHPVSAEIRELCSLSPYYSCLAIQPHVTFLVIFDFVSGLVSHKDGAAGLINIIYFKKQHLGWPQAGIAVNDYPLIYSCV